MTNQLRFLIALTAAASGLALMAQPTRVAASWQVGRSEAALLPTSQAQVAGVFLPTLSNVANPSLAVDRAGGIHMAFEPVSGSASHRMPVQYGYCAANCMRRESWRVAVIGDAGLPGSEVRLALTASGKPRLMWFSQPDWRKDGEHLFASCDRACTQAANWRAVAVATDSVGEGEGRYFALDADDNPHFLYSSSRPDHQGAFHRYCLSFCLSAQNWREQKISDNYLLGAFSLAFDARNRLRLALSAEQNGRKGLVFVICESECNTIANWKVTALMQLGNEYDLSLRLDAAGRPRLAVYAGNSGVSGEEKRLHYLQCDSDCHLFTNWTRSTVGLAEGEGGNLDLLLDDQSRPHMVVADSAYLPKRISLVTCSSRCSTSRPAWQRREIEDAEKVSARLCSVGYAYIGKRPALAWLGASRLLVAHGVENKCLGHDTSVHLVRLTAVN